MRAAILILVGTLTLSGCQTLESHFKVDPTNVEATMASSPTGKWIEIAPEDLPTTDWVGTFNDPQLQTLVSQALDANHDIASAEANYKAAMAALKIAQADRWPQLSANLDASRTERGNEFIPDSTNISYGVNASWEADIWGRIRDTISSSDYAAGASSADYAGVRLAIAGQVSETWFNLIEARLLTELAQRDVETQERALRLTTRRFEGGISGSSDVRLARSSLAASQATLALRKQNLASITRALEILMGHYPANAVQSARDLPQLPALSGVGDQAYVLRRRPDLLAAEQRMMAAGVEIDAARKALLPRLTLSGGVNGSGTALNNIFDIDALVANIAGGLVQPIFQGGRLKANVERQEYVLKQLIQSYAGRVLTAYLEVENALDAENRLAERETALRISLEEATQAEKRLETRYSEGLASILQLLDAQSRRISAESQLISARRERLANRVRLHVALGGGLETQNAIRLASNR